MTGGVTSGAQSLAVQLAAERRRLADLVRSGGDTSECRGRIAKLEAGVARQSATNDADVARRTRERDEISQIASERLRAIPAVTSPLSNPPPREDAADAAVQRDHHEAVAASLKAQEALRTASSRLDITATEVQSLAERTQALEQRRETMKHRRARGDTRPEDRGELELITLDLEALAPFVATAASANGGATAARDQAYQQLVEANRRLDAVEALIASLDLLRGIRTAGVFADAVGKALGDRFAELDRPSAQIVLTELVGLANAADAHILTLIDQMASVSVKAGWTGPTPAWGPTPKLANKIRDLAVQRG